MVNVQVHAFTEVCKMLLPLMYRYHNPNLMTILGLCMEQQHPSIVYEFMSNGSLDKWIFKNKVRIIMTSITAYMRHFTLFTVLLMLETIGEPLSWRHPYMMQNLAGGYCRLAYLHSLEGGLESMLHLDLKGYVLIWVMQASWTRYSPRIPLVILQLKHTP